MARLFNSGFEYGSLVAEGALASPGSTFANGTWTSGTTYNWKTTGARSGLGCLNMLGSGSGSLYYLQSPTLGTSLTNTYYGRLAIKATAWGTFLGSPSGVGWRPMGINDTSFNGVELQIDTSGNLGVYANGNTTLLSATTTALSLNTWYVLEISWVPSTGVFVLRVNGTQVQNGTGPTASAAAITTYSCMLAGTSQNALIDDWAVNDSTGGACNSWCGQGGLVLLTPTADSSRTGFTTGAGGTTSLFAAVDNLPPVGVAQGSATATSQIEDNTSNTTDNYVAILETYTAAGVPSGASIVFAQGIASMGNSTTTSRTAGIQSTANPVIAETTGGSGATAAATFPTGWTTLKTVISYGPSATLGNSPTIEFRKATASTDYMMADFLGLLVEYLTQGFSAPVWQMQPLIPIFPNVPVG